MIELTPETKKYLRTLLVLGRVSNLPTVWSNCLAGWLISGPGSIGALLLLCGGATALYIGGMYLNDAFDADFDRQFRRERPIPSGAISVTAVWRIGLAFTHAPPVGLVGDPGDECADRIGQRFLDGFGRRLERPASYPQEPYWRRTATMRYARCA